MLAGGRIVFRACNALLANKFQCMAHVMATIRSKIEMVGNVAAGAAVAVRNENNGANNQGFAVSSQVGPFGAIVAIHGDEFVAEGRRKVDTD